MRRLAQSLGIALLLVGAPTICRADAATTEDGSAASEDPTKPANEDAKHPPTTRTKKGYVQLFTTGMFGDGLRFNNPYRLATPLGSTAQSVSRTAAYADVGVEATFGPPLGFQHGIAVRASFAVEGVPQGVLAPGYLIWRRWGAWAAYGRASLPVIVLTPSTTVGFEGAVGGAWFVRSGIGITAEMVGDLFYGAGTRQVATPAYPVLSAQMGLTLAYEIFP